MPFCCIGLHIPSEEEAAVQNTAVCNRSTRDCASIIRYAFLEIVVSIRMAPEIEAGLRAEAAALGISVELLIANAVKAYLRHGTPTPPRRVSSRERSAEMTWASHPDAQFIGKWVVLQGGQVVTSSSDPKQLYKDVRAKGDSSPFLIFVSPDEQEPFAGGCTD